VRRRTFLALPAAAASVAAAQQATTPEALPATPYHDYSLCLPDVLRRLAARAYSRRNEAIARLTTPEAIRARQKWARGMFWKLVGGPPERTPLDARSTGTLVRDGYRVEKLVYQSWPSFFVSANLYVPAGGTPPFPGVLFQMGHSRNGKAYESYQRCCQGLVKLGFVVLGFDPIGQGERVFYPGEDPARSRLDSPDDEHTVPGRQMLLYGDTMSRLQVWDAVRSLDYLASHPLVDPKRLASTGQSGGATLTMMLGCVDDRLRAAAVASGNTENFACAGFNPPGSTDDAEQDFVDSGPAGFDRWDLLYPMAPNPLLISVSDKDWFGTYSSSYQTSGHEEFHKLRKVYAALGHANALQWTSTPLPHNLAYDSRLKIYNWFSRWLKGDSHPVAEEPATAPEAERELLVSESGSVVKSFASLSPFVMNRKRTFTRSAANLAGLTGTVRPAASARFAVLGRVPSRAVDIEAVEVAPEPRVWLPSWMFVPHTPDRSLPALLLLPPHGRNSDWHEGELNERLADAGAAVCVPDLRGAGDLSPEFGRHNAAYALDHHNDENYAWASLILGRPLAGQWATDILALAAAFRAHPAAAGRKLILAAAGRWTVPALIAAALDEKIAGLYLAGGIISFESVAATEDYICSFANFVPRLLLHTDLPETAASLGSRKLVIAGAVDARGTVVPEAEVRRLYPSATVLAAPRWDLETLSRLAS